MIVDSLGSIRVYRLLFLETAQVVLNRFDRANVLMSFRQSERPATEVGASVAPILYSKYIPNCSSLSGAFLVFLSFLFLFGDS